MTVVELPQISGRISLPRALEQAELFTRYSQLTLPTGALDALLKPALKILAQRKSTETTPLRIGFLLFAGDHAVAHEHATSAYPPEVTPQMVANILRGGAAISQLARRRGAPLRVCDVGVAAGFDTVMSVAPAQNITFVSDNVHKRFPTEGYERGARDLTRSSALSERAHLHCWNVGVRCVDELLATHNCDVIALGEMGIGNTTPATALASVLLGESPERCTGRGTGLNDQGLERKVAVVRAAAERVRPLFSGVEAKTLPWAHSLLQELGGSELSALAGAAWRAAEGGVMVLLDGVIVTAAIAPFALAENSLRSWLIASHRSAEHVHDRLLGALGLEPLLDLGLRLGEGSGAAFAAGLLQDADELLRQMATFESAGVSSN